MEAADLIVQTGISKAPKAAVFARLHARFRVRVGCPTLIVLVPCLAMSGTGPGIQHSSMPRDRDDKSEREQKSHVFEIIFLFGK